MFIHRFALKFNLMGRRYLYSLHVEISIVWSPISLACGAGNLEEIDILICVFEPRVYGFTLKMFKYLLCKFCTKIFEKRSSYVRYFPCWFLMNLSPKRGYYTLRGWHCYNWDWARKLATVPMTIFTLPRSTLTLRLRPCLVTNHK